MNEKNGPILTIGSNLGIVDFFHGQLPLQYINNRVSTKRMLTTVQPSPVAGGVIQAAVIHCVHQVAAVQLCECRLMTVDIRIKRIRATLYMVILYRMQRS